MRHAFAFALVVLLSLNWFQTLGAVELTEYEQGHVLRELQNRGWSIDANPDGKVIKDIIIHRFPVFVDFEKFPTFLNRFHKVTEASFIRREVISKSGDRFQQADLDETVRNLRSLGVFNLVVVVPVVTSDPQTVDLLVVTRDLWSLRLESAFQLTGTVMDRLQLQLTERNLFGRGVLALARYNLQPLFFSTGAQYSHRRVSDTDLSLTLASDIYFERERNRYDGYYVSLYVGRPLYKRSDRFSYGITGSRGEGIVRQEQAGQRLTWDDEETENIESVPRSWAYRRYSLGVSGALQYQLMYVFRIGAGLSVTQYDAELMSSPQFAMLAQDAQRRFQADVIPESLLLAYPQLSFSFYRDRFTNFRNLSGFQLTEQVQEGLSGASSVQFADRRLGSSSDVISLSGNLAYRWRWLSDGFFELAAGSSRRYRAQTAEWTDIRVLYRARFASPTTRLGRLVTRVEYLTQAQQITPGQLSLGGDNGLRGYSSQRFLSFGGNRLRSNLELRSQPRRWGPFYAGTAVFYDGGSLWGGTLESGWVHAVGLGVRAVMPQASSYPYRVDFGLPIDGSGFMVMLKGGTITVETNQAVPILPRDDFVYSNSVGGLASQP